MKNKIETLQINNYKSIETLEIDCKRINIFIGRPNVGKSNILEAISLLNANSLSLNGFFAKSGVRYEQLRDLFFFNDVKKPISLKTNQGSFVLKHLYHSDTFIFTVGNGPNIKISTVDESSGNLIERFKAETINPFYEFYDAESIPNRIIEPTISSINRNGGIDQMENKGSFRNPIKKYDFIRFDNTNVGNNRFYLYLNPPHGNNIIAILENDSDLMKECHEIFQEYNLELLISKDTNKDSIEIHRREGFYTYKIPFSSVADTLQRYIFHLSAIVSNHNSVLIFEEPEAHSFPPYIKSLATKIVEDAHNQYFISTHSPFLLNTVIENTDLADVNVFKVSYEQNRSQVTKLSDEELLDLINYGQDIFFNI